MYEYLCLYRRSLNACPIYCCRWFAPLNGTRMSMRLVSQECSKKLIGIAFALLMPIIILGATISLPCFVCYTLLMGTTMSACWYSPHQHPIFLDFAYVFLTFQSGRGICPLTSSIQESFHQADHERTAVVGASPTENTRLRKPSSSSWPRPFPIHITRHLVDMICDLLIAAGCWNLCFHEGKMTPTSPSCFLFCWAEISVSSLAQPFFNSINMVTCILPSHRCHRTTRIFAWKPPKLKSGSWNLFDLMASIAQTKAWNICKGDTVSLNAFVFHCWNKACFVFFGGGGPFCWWVFFCCLITWLLCQVTVTVFVVGQSVAIENLISRKVKTWRGRSHVNSCHVGKFRLNYSKVL